MPTSPRAIYDGNFGERWADVGIGPYAPTTDTVLCQRWRHVVMPPYKGIPYLLVSPFP